MPNQPPQSLNTLSRALPLSHALVAATTPRRWATASASGAPDTSPGDLDALGLHAEECRGARGRWFPALSLAESVSAFLAPRIVTTAALAALALGVVSLIA